MQEPRQDGPGVRSVVLAAGISLPATAGIGYAIGFVVSPHIREPGAWPPAWWPFAGASCAGFLPMAAGLAAFAAVMGYRFGRSAAVAVPTAVALQAALLVVDLPRAQAAFASSNLFPLAVVIQALLSVGLVMAAAGGAWYGARLRRVGRTRSQDPPAEE